MATLLAVKGLLRKELERKRKNASEVAKEVAGNILTYLATETPVDTTLAISNWQVGIGEPIIQAIDPHFEGYHGDTESQSAFQTMAIGQSILQSKRPGQSIYISNRAHHIEDLNEDRIKYRIDQQHPNIHFVEDAIAEGRRVLELRRG